MSYVTMDHAEWVEENIRAAKRNAAREVKRRKRIHGLEVGPEKLSEFQARVMDILGIVGGGIYNAPIDWDTIEWHPRNGISLIWEGEFSTFDFNKLTKLVFLCHEARIRLNLRPAKKTAVHLSFWQRDAGGNSYYRHPNLDEAVASFREYVPAKHRIFYRDPAASSAPDENETTGPALEAEQV